MKHNASRHAHASEPCQGHTQAISVAVIWTCRCATFVRCNFVMFHYIFGKRFRRNPRSIRIDLALCRRCLHSSIRLLNERYLVHRLCLPRLRQSDNLVASSPRRMCIPRSTGKHFQLRKFRDRCTCWGIGLARGWQTLPAIEQESHPPARARDADADASTRYAERALGQRAVQRILKAKDPCRCHGKGSTRTWTR